MSDEGKLFIGGLSYDTEEDALSGAFEKYGAIEKCAVVRDRDTDRSRGFGFVTFQNPEDAVKALEEMNQTILDGRQIRVDTAGKGSSGRGSRGGGDRRYGGGGGRDYGGDRDYGGGGGRDYGSGGGRDYGGGGRSYGGGGGGGRSYGGSSRSYGGGEQSDRNQYQSSGRESGRGGGYSSHRSASYRDNYDNDD